MIPPTGGRNKTGCSLKAGSSFLYPALIAGAVVVADNRLGSLAQALEGQHGELHDAGENGHGSYCDVAAVV